MAKSCIISVPGWTTLWRRLETRTLRLSRHTRPTGPIRRWPTSCWPSYTRTSSTTTTSGLPNSCRCITAFRRAGGRAIWQNRERAGNLKKFATDLSAKKIGTNEIEQIDYFRSRNESWPLIFCRKKLNFCLWRSLSFFLLEFARKCWRCNRWGPFIHRSRPGMRQRGRLCWTCCASFTAAEKRIAQIIVSHDLALVTNYNQTYLHRVQSWYCLSKVLPTYLFLLPT